MKINKKQLGSSVRRGALAGTFGGFLAGWLAFAAHAVELPAVDVSAEIQYEVPAPVPAMPTLRAVPTQAATPDPTAAATPEQQAAQAAQTGNAAAPAAGAPAPLRAPTAAQPVVPPAPAPVFVPAPPVPKTVVKPAPITAPSKKP